MKNLNTNQRIILFLIFISITNIFICSFFYVYLYSINKNITETELIKEYNIRFNKNTYYLGLNETIDIIIENKNYTKIDIYIEDETIATLDKRTITGKNYGETGIDNEYLYIAESLPLKGCCNKKIY